MAPSRGPIERLTNSFILVTFGFKADFLFRDVSSQSCLAYLNGPCRVVCSCGVRCCAREFFSAANTCIAESREGSVVVSCAVFFVVVVPLFLSWSRRHGPEEEEAEARGYKTPIDL